MIFGNNSPANVQFVGGALAGVNTSGSDKNWCISHARAFGSDKSSPQGYNDVQKAITPPLRTNGNIAALLRLDVDAFSTLTAFGNIQGSLSVDIDIVGNANVYSNMYASISLDVDITGSILAIGNMSGVIDFNARPSAFDIAQEVWNGTASAYNNPGTMGEKLNDAGGAGNPWSSLLLSNATPATFGKLLQDMQVLVDEMHKLQGLDPANPMTVTPTSRTVGTINQEIGGDGTTNSIVTRQL